MEKGGPLDRRDLPQRGEQALDGGSGGGAAAREPGAAERAGRRQLPLCTAVLPLADAGEVELVAAARGGVELLASLESLLANGTFRDFVLRQVLGQWAARRYVGSANGNEPTRPHGYVSHDGFESDCWLLRGFRDPLIDL